METKRKIDPELFRPHALVKGADCKEAGLTDQELLKLAEEIRTIIMPEKGYTLPEYVEVCKSINHSVFGYRKLMALYNEPKLSALFPDEVYEILKNKGRDKQILYFDDSDDNFLRQHAHRGVDWLSKRLYCVKSTIYKRADLKHIYIPRTHAPYTAKEDAFIRANISKGFSWIGNYLGRNKAAIHRRSLRLGFSFDSNLHRYTPEDDDFIRKHVGRGAAYLASQLHINFH